MTAYGLLQPANGDRINAAYVSQMDTGIDYASQMHSLVVPIMTPGGTGAITSGTGVCLRFSPTVDVTPVSLALFWSGGVSTTQMKLQLTKDDGTTLLASVTTASGAANAATDTTSFSNLDANGHLTGGAFYKMIVLAGSGGSVTTCTSCFGLLQYRIPYAKHTLTDDATTLASSIMNDFEAGVQNGGRYRVMCFGLTSPLATGNKAKFKVPALASGPAQSWKVEGFRVWAKNLSAVSGTPSLTVQLQDKNGTVLNTATPSGSGDQFANDDTLNSLTTSNGPYVVKVTAAGGTSPSVDLVNVTVVLRIDYTKQTWSTNDDVCGGSGTRFTNLDLAVQNIADWHIVTTTLLNTAGGISSDAGPTLYDDGINTFTKIQGLDLQVAYKITAPATAASTLQVDGIVNNNDIQQVSTIAKGTTVESLDEQSTPTSIATNGLASVEFSAPGAAGQTVTYAVAIFLFSIGLAAITKVTTPSANPKLPTVGVIILNQAQVGAYPTTDTVTHTPASTRAPARTPTETITHSPSTTRAGARSLLQTITRTPTLARAPTRALPTDATHHADALTRQPARTPTETITHTVTTSRASTRQQAADAIHHADAGTRGPARTLPADTIHHADPQLARAAGRTAATETITHRDADSRQENRTLTETVHHGDSSTRQRGRALNETLNHADASQRIAARALPADHVTHTNPAAPRALQRNIAGIIFHSDQQQRVFYLTVAETLHHADSSTRAWVKAIAAETVHHAASLTATRTHINTQTAYRAKKDLELYLDQILVEAYWASLMDLTDSIYEQVFTA